VAELYWARWGIETVSIRIGSALPAPKDRRMLSTWISCDDLERLVVSALTAPIVGHTIIFGMSDNQTSWWDNTHAKHIGYRALDSSDVFRHEVEARQPHIDRHDKAALFQGGAFVKIAPHVK
jgi:uronate dehydrogenase